VRFILEITFIKRTTSEKGLGCSIQARCSGDRWRRGIGLGIALKLAEAGFTLVISGRRSLAQVQSALDQIRELSAASIYVQADVASGDDRRHLLDTVEETLGRLDVLVNNAGIAPHVRADLLAAQEESFDEVMATILKALFLTQQLPRG